MTRQRILVVDDEPSNLDLMRRILNDDYDYDYDYDYDLAFAKSGHDALQSLQVKPADLILVDVTMPGMDGYQACQAIKADPSTRGDSSHFLCRADRQRR